MASFAFVAQPFAPVSAQTSALKNEASLCSQAKSRSLESNFFGSQIAADKVAFETQPASFTICNEMKSESTSSRRRFMTGVAGALAGLLAVESAAFAESAAFEGASGAFRSDSAGAGAKFGFFQKFPEGPKSPVIYDAAAQDKINDYVARIEKAGKVLQRAKKNAEKAYWGDLRGDIRGYTGTLSEDIKSVSAVVDEKTKAEIASLEKSLRKNLVDADLLATNQTGAKEAAKSVEKAIENYQSIIKLVKPL